jgi:hypothetical protein
MANSSAEDFGCNISEFSWVFKWPTQVVKIFGAILMSLMGYLRAPLKCLTFWVQYW